jgi:hypothetical protein
MNIRIELVAVYLDRELLIIIDGNEDLLGAYGLLLRVVELGHVLVAQRLVRCQSFVRVELQ